MSKFTEFIGAVAQRGGIADRFEDVLDQLDSEHADVLAEA